jgi:hypothetical protein
MESRALVAPTLVLSEQLEEAGTALINTEEMKV